MTTAGKALAGLRVLYGLFFFGTGLFIAAFVLFGVGTPPSQLNAEAQAFTDALTRARIIDPLLALSYLGGGGALLFRRTAPLGLVLLAPAVTVITAFHAVLDGVWGISAAIGVIFGLLAWHFRMRFRPLWSG